MTETIWQTKTYTVMECGKAGCGISFALADEFIAARRKDHATFFCPNGHQRYFPQDNEAEKLRKQVEREKENARFWRDRNQDSAEEARHQAARANGYKGALTKTKKRISKGACPCCNRHFTNVERHMSTQHPEYAGPTPEENTDA